VNSKFYLAEIPNKFLGQRFSYRSKEVEIPFPILKSSASP
jgi:hypothetical protein